MNISQSIQTAQSTRPGAPASGPTRNKFERPPTLNFKLGTWNSRSAFTLIELLTVIAIIGLLAALIVGGATYATTAKIKSRVTTERNALETSIDRYKKVKGFYPPDGGTDPNCIQTPLFYELTGTSVSGNQPNVSFFSQFSVESLQTNQIGALFNLGGFINAGDANNPPQNFYDGLKNAQHLIVSGITQNTTNTYTFTVLGVPASGPMTLNPGTNGQTLRFINPWRYNSSHPTNNPNSYDLWMDVKYGGKTYRISNWSADPQPIGP